MLTIRKHLTTHHTPHRLNTPVHPFIQYVLAAAAVLMLASCFDIHEPIVATHSVINAIDDPLEGQGGDKSNDADSSAVSTIETLSYTVADNQSTITLLWGSVHNYTYTIARASNPDCNPIDASQCVNFVAFNDVQPPLTDASLNDDSLGSTYYYWVLAQFTPAFNQQSVNASSTAEDNSLIVSDSLRVSLEFPDHSEMNSLEETPNIELLTDLSLLRTAKKSASLSWQHNPELTITVYGSLDADCDVLDASSNCAETLALEHSASSTTLAISSNYDMDNYYFWVHANSRIPLLSSSNQMESRLYGPMRSSYLANANGTIRPSIQITEKATFDEHSLSVGFDAPTNLVPQFASYNFYTLSGSKAADTKLIEDFFASENQLPSLDALRQLVSNAEGNLSLGYESKKFQDLKQSPTGEMFFELDSVQADTWYTIIVIADENQQIYKYQASARKTLQRLRVNAQGTNGLWTIRDKASRAVHIAKTGSGFYYPSTNDWRDIMIDAELAFPDKQAYYFTGCAYYHDEPVLGGTPRLFNNECHYAQLDTTSGHVNTVLSKPLPVTIVFERKANALACHNYTELPAHGYNRSRNYRLGAYEDSICDHRIATHNSDGDYNRFVMVYPHGEPTTIARNQVPQWFGGTQVPLYISGNAPLPAVPDGIVHTTVCSDLGEDRQCSFKEQIQVLRCNGYYSYELAQPTGCSVGYAWEESPVSALHRKAAGNKSQ